ncbi:B3 domain-containing protein REM16-like [Chenopodium quinoa]|uniref:B3 domain-containing protein REM16-like n=1 Tax=Chenopodium quinoa TaxID=63459 RepID=UPI000B796239|nr:B3 domain-containing protein REM16-like [Chenopodium quinoa]
MKNKTWEEEIYWKNFHFSQFSLTLPTDFHQHLTLPKKFSDNMRAKLPEQVVLKVNGVSWNVNLKKNKDDIMFHGDGWEEFGNAYSLKKADVLVFKYNRRECFEVWLFDRASSCEKEASYFVRKPQQHNSDDGDDEEDHNDDCSEDTAKSLTEGEFTDDTSQEDHDDCHYDASRDRRRKTPVRTPKSSSAKPARSKDVSDDPDESDENSDEEFSISEEAKTTPNKAATTNSAGKLPTNASRKRNRNGAKKIFGKGSGSSLYSVCYKSNRRKITDEEIANALRKAKVAKEQHVNSFHVVMRPSCVYRRFFMTIPAEWELKSQFRKGQEVSLRMQGKIWECSIYKDGTKLGFQGSRWKTFARDNFLEEYDVCLFVPSVSKNERFVLDVTIFRVVPDIVLPSVDV